MACPQCADTVEHPELPHVIRKCESCGRELHVHEVGADGHGFKIRKGEQVVIPQAWLEMSFNPLKSTGRFYPGGLDWYAAQIHMGDLHRRKNDVLKEVEDLELQFNQIVAESSLLDGLDTQSEEDGPQIVERLKGNRSTKEWWAFLAGFYLSLVREGLDQRDTVQAAWAMGCAERCRAMVIFKEHLEDVVWMGHSAKKLVDVLRTWDTNQDQANEKFWQRVFRENSYVLGQVFAVPLVFIQESAYIGGMKVDGKGANLVDYLFSEESSGEAILVEIKTPATNLIGSRYRGTYRPTQELSGAVIQALNYRRSLIEEYAPAKSAKTPALKARLPKCVVIAGNGSRELADPQKRDAFELFRANSRDVEIITYDELFRKLEVLAALFNLKRS